MTDRQLTDTRAARLEQAALELAIAEKVCRACGTRGEWRITGTQHPIRYLECLFCGVTDKIVSKAQAK